MINVLKKVFSMPLMAIFLVAFFLAIASATFIENDFGTPVAQKWVFKAFWFEFILGYLFLTLCFNLYRYKLFQWKKIGSLIFHVAFLVIVIGAWVTRLIGFEGAMQIREGGSSNIVISYDTYVQWKVHDLDQQYVDKLPVILDGHTDNYFSESFAFPGETEPISLEFVELKEGVKDTIIETGASKGDPYLELVTVGTNGRQYNYLKSGDVIEDGGLKIAFNNNAHTDAVSIFETDSGMYVKTPFELGYFQMSDKTEGVITRDSIQKFKTKRLYSAGDFQFVFNAFYKSAAVELIESDAISKDVKAVTVRASQGDLSHDVVLRGGKGMFPRYEKFQLGNLNYELAYGSELRELPFWIYLDDFELERYPGTDQPSSYSSRVTLVDPVANVEQKHHVFMNNVLDYQGYRFFQSSYDKDELGTILSVNFDAPGTTISYIGYLLLAIGFVISLLTPHGRFRLLIRKSIEISKKRAELLTVLILFSGFLGSGQALAQDVGNAAANDIFTEFDGENPAIDFAHAEKYGRLVVQNQRGRFEPVHTIANDLLKKVSRQSTYNDQSAMQVFLGIHTNSMAWNMEPFIYVSGSALRKKLNIDGKYASFVDFFSFDFQYLLVSEADEARRKKPAERSQIDKDVLKTDERVNLLFGVFTGAYLKIMPLPNDPNENWYSPFDEENPFEGEDAEFMNSIVPLYNTTVNSAHETGDWSQADKVVELIDLFQRNNADPNTIPSREKIKLEITYNKMDVFKRLMNLYLLAGLLILVLAFIVIFKPKVSIKWGMRLAFFTFLIMAIAHGSSLGIRWYLSGHAPWSNGYEAVVFIAFIVAALGLALYRLFPIVLGAAGVLAWLLLFVAHMNQLDPEMTQLVPVLKSYWLMIHVAVITGSYAFLGLGAILALIILVLNLFVNVNNKKRLLLTTKQLTYISEMVIMIGLFMLTVGTFLGGIWANESWGRYWGWDAKETWALASVVVYVIVLHFRFIPGLKGQFAFNVASLWAYGSIIMTFFGVNFYLSGLHSYAAGDPIPVPTWVPITVLLLLILSVGSGLVMRSVRKTKVQKVLEQELDDDVILK
ncbi:MAG: cytochrome C biogenesis protein [Crocinitomix sp.]|nr:cytochrome C biogenesis protein [Crocinitomix sp.]